MQELLILVNGMTIRTPMKPNNKTQAFITLEESLFIDYFTFTELCIKVPLKRH